MFYLLSWLSTEDLQIQDSNGHTPLHLAVKSAESLETTRPVRALLFRNADKEIKDIDGRRPVDLVGELDDNRL